MDDILPGTKPPTPAVIFVDVPAHTETKLGAPVVLSCRTAFPVIECQWSWRPLPSTHFPLPEINDSSFVPTCEYQYLCKLYKKLLFSSKSVFQRISRVLHFAKQNRIHHSSKFTLKYRNYIKYLLLSKASLPIYLKLVKKINILFYKLASSHF